MSVEVIEYGQEQTSRGLGSGLHAWAHRYRLVLIGLALVVLLAAAADQWQRQRELNGLLDRVAAAEAAIADTEARTSGTLAYWGPVLSGSGYTPAVRASFTDDLEEVGLAGAILMTDQARALNDSTLLPWHSTLREAQAAYAERLGLWEVYFREMARDPDALFLPRDPLDESALSAAAALEAAVPWFSDAADRARVDLALPPPR